MRRFPRWYGASPLHLLTLLGCFALAGYAVAELLPNNFIGIPVWLAGAPVALVAVTGGLFLLSAAALALRLRRSRRGAGNAGAPPLTGPPNEAQEQGAPPGRAG